MMLLPSITRPWCATRIWARNRVATCTNFAAARACSPRRFLMVTSQLVMSSGRRGALEEIRCHPDGVPTVLAQHAGDLGEVLALAQARRLDQHRQIDPGDHLDAGR